MPVKKTATEQVLQSSADPNVEYRIAEGADVTVITEPGMSPADVTGITEPEDGAVGTEADDTEPSMRINLHVLIDLNPNKWSYEAPVSDAPSADAVRDALIAAGIAPEIATEMAAKATKAPSSAASGVREQLREYVLGEMRKLQRLADAGAEVNYYERPVK